MTQANHTALPQPPRRRFLLFVLLGMLAAFVVAILLINFVLLPWHVRIGKEVAVPDVLGMTQEDAVKALKTKGLALGDVRFVADTLAPVGKIVDTRPRVGSRTKAGRAVGLDVSAGQEKTQVPMVFKLPVKRAQAAIENAGLRVGQIVSQYSGSVPEGQVIGTVPGYGLKVPKGSAVDVTVSMGSRGTLEMPALKGMLLSRAKDVLINSGLALGPVSEVTSTLPPGTVVSQEPPEHTEMSPGDTVQLRVAKAGAAKPPDTKGKTSTTPGAKMPDTKKTQPDKGKTKEKK
jgi:beta-lactam-binding protein with PASTA domain